MKDIKAIFLDFDGTLLNNENKISEYNKLIISKCINKNIKIIPATARGFYRIKPYLRELNLLNNNCYSICYNSAIIVDNEETEIFSSHINNKDIILLDNFISKYDVDWYYYLNNRKICRKNINNIEQFIKENKVYKVSGGSNLNLINNIKKNLPDFIHNKFEYTSSFENRIAFMNKGINKLIGIKFLLKKLNISENNIITIGDGENDIEMIKYAKYGVAMINSPKSVKNNASIISKYSNDNDGVGFIITDLLNLESSDN